MADEEDVFVSMAVFRAFNQGNLDFMWYLIDASVQGSSHGMLCGRSTYLWEKKGSLLWILYWAVQYFTVVYSRRAAFKKRELF